MSNNDILRSIRYTFDFSDFEMINVFSLAGETVTRAQVSDWLKKEDDPEFQPIYDKDLAIYLNGLINLKRGKKEGEQPAPEKSMSNNIVFRKLKIALNLKDEDILDILEKVDMKISKHELSAFFRNPSQSQYRPLKDQILRYFLRGLQVAFRKD